MSERELDQELGNNWKTEVWEGRKVRDYDRERRCSQPVRNRGERVSEEGL